MQTEQNQNGTSTGAPVFTPKVVIPKKPSNIDVQLSPEVPISEEDKKKVIHIVSENGNISWDMEGEWTLLDAIGALELTVFKLKDRTNLPERMQEIQHALGQIRMVLQ